MSRLWGWSEGVRKAGCPARDRGGCWSETTSFPFAFQLLHFARRLLGQRLFDKLMKMTFYGQFVAGEDQESIQPLIRHNRAFGVGSILDYGVEEDLSQEEAERQEME